MILLALSVKMPESPYFLVTKHHNEEAKEALLKVRFEDQIDWELEQLEIEVLSAEELQEANWEEIQHKCKDGISSLCWLPFDGNESVFRYQCNHVLRP